MAFRLKPDKSPVSGIVRIARQQIDRAAAGAGATGRPPMERIHQARTRCKKIRALLRLIRPHDEKFYRRENARFRDLARPLSFLRDTDVMLESLDRLLQQKKPGPVRRDFSAVRRALRAGREKLLAEAGEIERRLARFAGKMGRERERFDRVGNGGFAAVAAGLARTYRAGRRAMRKACAAGTAENFHEWRKQVNHCRYQLRMLRRIRPLAMKKAESRAALLADLLGEDHDLGMLRQFLQSAATGIEEPKSLVELIERRRGEIRAEAIVLGGRLFAEKPSGLERQVAQWWRIAQRRARAAKKNAG